ncbi:uncharacterized protein K460DRAFT_389002 [Cucurbitaria berberidis CBS 394.84]|uniref:Alpha-galactosidase A n=1 Tax=Cucurbitaria berberidis CBS 394.84 TaxID=1168544 RepID=A0A9P4L5T2_9PLEO|nr:uncharacterized protein K460DRAFT_389002 [Cucurbitaria berberidis CBS 394.84]KAF1842333.1 hypothetical protein K460DRAFT_389002 [Cucurbitaria berberidis CBS 394.84]
MDWLNKRGFVWKPEKYRVLFVKYLTIDAGIYDVEDMCFGPCLVSIIPPLPPGDWNKGHITRNTSDGRPHFAEATNAPLLGVTHLWHPLQIDHLELCMGQKLRSNVYEATCPRFNTTIIAKFARFAWEIPQLNAETSAYEWIENQQIGPGFLGHLSEEGRVIGFIMERITDARHATPEDLPLCQLALLKLHKLGIRHGDLNKHNILILDGKATLLDFDHSTPCHDPKALDEEFSTLQKELCETSGRGGTIVHSNAV